MTFFPVLNSDREMGSGQSNINLRDYGSCGFIAIRYNADPCVSHITQTRTHTDAGAQIGDAISRASQPL